MKELTFTITGQPVVLKNSKRIVRQGNKTRLIPSAKVLKAEQSAIYELREQLLNYGHGKFPIAGWLHVQFTFFGAWKEESRNLPDLSNLFEAPQDWLQKTGIIADDRQIVSLDYSRRVPMCDTCALRQRYVKGEKKGRFKPDCGAVKKCQLEHTKIRIKEFEL